MHLSVGDKPPHCIVAVSNLPFTLSDCCYFDNSHQTWTRDNLNYSEMDVSAAQAGPFDAGSEQLQTRNPHGDLLDGLAFLLDAPSKISA